MKLVIVEDNPTLRKVYTTFFTAKGFEVFSSPGGHEGLSLIQSHKPDAALLDIMLLDGMNGFDILEHMKRFPETQNIPAIILTNLDTEGEMAKRVGAAGYFIKANTDLEKLEKSVREIIAKNGIDSALR